MAGVLRVGGSQSTACDGSPCAMCWWQPLCYVLLAARVLFVGGSQCAACDGSPCAVCWWQPVSVLHVMAACVLRINGSLCAACCGGQSTATIVVVYV